jgi:hypothetical protein
MNLLDNLKINIKKLIKIKLKNIKHYLKFVCNINVEVIYDICFKIPLKKDIME